MSTETLQRLIQPRRWMAPMRRLLSRRIDHIVGIACTGHGASIAYVGADGTVRGRSWTAGPASSTP